MNKQKLIVHIAKETNLTWEQTQKTIHAILDTSQNALTSWTPLKMLIQPS